MVTGVCGCSAPPPEVVEPSTAVDVRHACPFAPVELRVHPLTHVELDGEGESVIILHVELHDAWGEATKATGDLVITLARGSGGPNPALANPELTWRDDLSDLSRNVRLWDPATRTYRVPLGRLPPWLTPSLEGPPAYLDVALTTRGRSGEERVLRDTFVLR